MEESSYHSSDDNDFADEESASVQLENLSDFEEEDKEELHDLEDEALTHNRLSCKMPPKKDTHSTRNSKSPKNSSVDDVIKILDTTFIASGPNGAIAQ